MFLLWARFLVAPILRALLRPSRYTRYSAGSLTSERAMDFQRWGSGQWGFFFSLLCLLACLPCLRFSFFAVLEIGQGPPTRFRCDDLGWDHEGTGLE